MNVFNLGNRLFPFSCKHCVKAIFSRHSSNAIILFKLRCFAWNTWACYKTQSSWSKGISETKSKHQTPCSNCMHLQCDVTGQFSLNIIFWPVMSHGWCMHLLHGFWCLDLVSDIPLLQVLWLNVFQCHTYCRIGVLWHCSLIQQCVAFANASHFQPNVC